MSAPAQSKASKANNLASEGSRERIMAAASELAKERGVSGATIAQVCQRSGLPVSSVYWHFEDKDHLFAEVIRSSFAKWLVSVPRWDVSEDTTVTEGLRRILGQSTKTFSELPAFLRIGMQVLLETGENHVKTREAYIAAREQVRLMITAWMSELLPDAIDSDTSGVIASLVVAFSDGMVVGSQVYPEWEPDVYVDLLAGAIAALIDPTT